MRKTVVWVGALAAVAEILDWLERSQWVRLLPSVAVTLFPLVFNLSLLALIAMGLWKIAGLEKQRAADRPGVDPLCGLPGERTFRWPFHRNEGSPRTPAIFRYRVRRRSVPSGLRS
jgi:hypothetical protein